MDYSLEAKQGQVFVSVIDPSVLKDRQDAADDALDLVLQLQGSSHHTRF